MNIEGVKLSVKTNGFGCSHRIEFRENLYENLATAFFLICDCLTEDAAPSSDLIPELVQLFSEKMVSGFGLPSGEISDASVEYRESLKKLVEAARQCEEAKKKWSAAIDDG